LDAHRLALRYGGRPGVLNLGSIESALGRPYSGYHRTIDRKAAALLHALIGNHGFVDANKRTAWLLTELVIKRSGFRLAVGDGEPIDDLVVAVAAGEMEFEPLVEWFRARIVPE
jgi:death-on-curing protein